MKYYLHRIVRHRPEWSIPLLHEKNLLSIGWAWFGSDSDFVSKHQQDNWNRIPDAAETKYQKRRQGFGLQRFLRMEEGDQVVVPTWKAFDVYRVADGARLVPAEIEKELAGLEIWRERNAAIRDGRLVERTETTDKLVDLGFFRQVEPIRLNIPRKGYADAQLTSRLKVRQTNVEITGLGQSVQAAIKAHREQNPINLRDFIKETYAIKVRDAILKIQDSAEFEKLIESYLNALGASAVIPSKNEPGKVGDADIVAIFDSLKLIVYVQAKRHEGETDARAVEQIESYKDDREGSDPIDEYTHVAWVVSTADGFSDECKKLAKDKKVRLINGIEFAEMLLDAGIEHL